MHRARRRLVTFASLMGLFVTAGHAQAPQPPGRGRGGLPPGAPVPPSLMLAAPKPVTRSRPLCQYPLVAKYKGTRRTDDAANFVCNAGF